METATLTSFLSQPQIMPFIKVAPWVLAILVVWSLVWKGWALWKAARLSSKWWFIILLLVNTVGILEIIYIFFIAKKYTVEVEKQA
jgi:hypothetical protein